MKKYDVILADPPWSFRVWSRDTGMGRSAESHYKTMTIQEIADLPIKNLAANDCALFCWVTWPLLYESKPIFDSWGFSYKTVAFNWVKTTKNAKIFFGLGYWTRACSEICLLLTRGNPRRKDKGIPQIIWEEYDTPTLFAPFAGHSVKPEAQYDRIERLTGSRYIELFARQQRQGWDCWGLEAPNSISLEKYKGR